MAGLAFVKHGLMAVRRRSEDGLARAIAVIGPGHLLGQSAHAALPAMFTIQALTPVAACAFPTRVLQDLPPAPAGQPGIAMQHLRLVVQTLADWSSVARVPGLLPRFAMALRLLAALQPTRPLLVPDQGVLAELLGVTRESINRAWRELASRGVVRHRHRQVVELDLDRLSTLDLGSG